MIILHNFTQNCLNSLVIIETETRFYMHFDVYGNRDFLCNNTCITDIY